MKRMLILILGLSLASAATFAGDEDVQKRYSDRMAQMKKNLGLTDEQVAQIRKIRNERGSREEILAVLTDEQIEIMKKRRAQMQGKGNKYRVPAPAKEDEKSETGEG